jgi:hypothetical protein
MPLLLILPLLLHITILAVDAKIRNKAYCEESTISKATCIDKTYLLQFNRIMKRSDPHKHISLKIYSLSKETSLINTMILFYTNNNMREYHNAFMIGSMKVGKYYHVTRESRLFYNNEITILSKAVKFVIPYSILTPMDRLSVYDPDSNGYFEQAYDNLLTLNDNEEALDVIHQADKESIYANGLATRWDPFVYYDALLSLDPYSSIWDHYNTYTVERDTLSLRKDENGQLNDNIDDFDGINRIQCGEPSLDDTRHRKIHSKACLVQNVPSTEGLTVNGKFFTNFKLVIDLTLKVNSIPTPLFFKWRDEGKEMLDFKIQLSNTTYFNPLLTLTSKFGFEINDNDVIIIGVDLLHYFPKVEYSVVQKQFNVWYQSNLFYTRQYEWIKIITLFLFIALLVCFFCWSMDINYNVYTLLLHFDIMSAHLLKGEVYFAFQQVTYEVIAILINIILWILGTIFITSHNGHSTSMFTYDHSRHRRVFTLFLFMSIYHVIILLFIIIMTKETNRKWYKYYKLIIEEYINPYEPTSLPTTTTATTDKVMNNDHLYNSHRGSGGGGGGVYTNLFLLGDPQNETVVATTITEKTEKQRKKKRSKQPKEIDTEREDAESQEIDYRERYHNRIVSSPYPLVLIRNVSFVTIVLISVVFSLVFFYDNIYRLYEVVMCYLLTFFMSYFILLLIIYIVSSASRVYNRRSMYILYVIFLIAEVAIFIGFIAWSMISIHIDYFQHINSIYTDWDVYTFVLCLTSTLILLSGLVIMTETDTILKERFYIM